jgi:hypothetical protein
MVAGSCADAFAENIDMPRQPSLSRFGRAACAGLWTGIR